MSDTLEKAPTVDRSIAPKRFDSELYQPRRFNKRSRQRFTASRSRELLKHLGREPSFPERIIISRIVAIEYELKKYDDALDRGAELSGHLLRARLAAENRLRLDLVALGLQPKQPAQMDALTYLAAKRAGNAAA
jgi:hypothetical protein